MNKLATLLFLIAVSMSSAQTASRTIELNKPTKSKVHSVSYTVDSVQELETIDWISIKEIFEDNKKTEIIKMSFGVNLKKSKINFKSAITVSGETKDIDSLIVKAKKAVNAIMKISKKYQNK
jgi:hypothetical protein